MSDQSRVGDLIAEKYRLEELLGSGGMGEVYRAVNEDVGRVVAIKVLHRHHLDNAPLVERFVREARLANLVRHPNVVDVIDLGREVSGAPFIVQELLVGEDLAHYVARRGGKLGSDEVVAILGPVIDAVAEAHAAGVIHRDIKPDNVFLVKGAHTSIPKLLDFGVSKARRPELRATAAGVVMGTPAYMPPEQAHGAGEADARSDVWALGVMLFELIAGRLPFQGSDLAALFLAIATEDAPTLLELGVTVPPDISLVVARCLRRDPDERYQSAAELARDLRHATEGRPLEQTGRRSVPVTALGPEGQGATPGTEAPYRPTLESSPAIAIARRNPTRDSAPAIPVELGAFDAAPTEPGRLPDDHPVPDLPVQPPAPRDVNRISDLGQLHAAPARVLIPRTRELRLAPETRADGTSVPSQRSVETSSLTGVALVSVVLLFGVGALMQLLHRPDGWPVGNFVLAPGGAATALHGFLSLGALLVGGAYCRRALRHWRGDLAGGPPSAIVNALIAAAAFFGAIELVSAAL